MQFQQRRIFTVVLAAISISAWLFFGGSLPGINATHKSEVFAASNSGAVFTETNETENQVYYYQRAANGSLHLVGVFSTQGQGLAGSFANQGTVALSQDRKFLYVVNFGSNDVTAFAVSKTALSFVGRYPSGGTTPQSIAIHGNLLYVLNQADPANITGFQRNADGSLTALGSTQGLSGPGVRGVQVSFNNQGTLLVVAENLGNNIDTFTVNHDGTANAARIQASAGPGPYGFVFDHQNHLLVSESKMSSMSSYLVSKTGKLRTVSGEVLDFGKAACWAAVTSNPQFQQQYVYTTNTGSDTVSGYSVASNGALMLLNPSDGVTFALPSGAHPLDEGVDAKSRYLYVLGEFLGTIYTLQIHTDGSLTELGVTSGLPTTSYGLASF